MTGLVGCFGIRRGCPSRMRIIRKIHPTDAAVSDAILAEEKAKVEAKAKAATEAKANTPPPLRLWQVLEFHPHDDLLVLQHGAEHG